jgi:hypothetical protein
MFVGEIRDESFFHRQITKFYDLLDFFSSVLGGLGVLAREV